MRSAGLRPTWAEIDVPAMRHNAGVLARLSSPAALCAVVKAGGYGHGAVVAARAALDGGASWLAVALVEEGVELRDAGIDAPILLLSEPPVDAARDVVEAALVPTVYTPEGIAALADAAAGHGAPLAVHLKIDTGMHRVGAAPAEAAALAAAIGERPALRLAGTWTHLAVADGGDADADYTAGQLDRLAVVVAELRAGGVDPGLLHAANSAGAIAHPASRLDLVRCGIALYGEVPSPLHAGLVATATGGDRLQPVLSLKSRVTLVRELEAGERPSYGRHRALPERALVATVPIGYADGVARRLFETGGEVLIGGVRRPLAGMVTMDQVVVDCGPGPVRAGDEVVLIGRQGDDAITATEWADRLGTISYEVLCAIGPRVPRRVVDDGAPAPGTPAEVSLRRP